MPPLRINGSAKCAMRMKVQQDTSMVVEKAVARNIDNSALQRILWREGDGVHDKIKVAPVVGDAFEHCLHLPGRANVKRHHDRRLQLARERLDVFLRPCRLSR